MTEPKTPIQPTFSREVLDLFDEYVHGAIDRRAFLRRSAAHLGSLAAASTVLAALTPNFARGQVIKPDDKRLAVASVDIDSPQGSGRIRAYVAQPAGSARKAGRPVIVVVHENRGLNPHIEDIARRIALEGYIALAPDALTTLGGYPGDEDKAREMFAPIDRAKIGEDFVAAARFALTMPGSNGKLGTTGFCFGGGIANLLAVRVPELRVAVPFYGSAAPLALVPNIRAELLLHFAMNDARNNALWPPYEEALKRAGKTYQAFTYEGTEHGFNNDTTPRFHKAAAKLAWSRTLALFKRTLS